MSRFITRLKLLVSVTAHVLRHRGPLSPHHQVSPWIQLTCVPQQGSICTRHLTFSNFAWVLYLCVYAVHVLICLAKLCLISLCWSVFASCVFVWFCFVYLKHTLGQTWSMNQSIFLCKAAIHNKGNLMSDRKVAGSNPSSGLSWAACRSVLALFYWLLLVKAQSAQSQKDRLTYKTYLASYWANHLSVSLPWVNLNQSDQQYISKPCKMDPCAHVISWTCESTDPAR